MNLIYENEWNSYEEGCSIQIFEKDDEYFYTEKGHSVFIGWHESNLIPISFEDALDILDEWEKINES